VSCDTPPLNERIHSRGSYADNTSAPFATALALTSLAAEERFTQSLSPSDSAKPMIRIFFAAFTSLSCMQKHRDIPTLDAKEPQATSCIAHDIQIF